MYEMETVFRFSLKIMVIKGSLGEQQITIETRAESCFGNLLFLLTEDSKS